MRLKLYFLPIFLLLAVTSFSQLNCGTDHAIRQYYESRPKEYTTFVNNELSLQSSILQKSGEDTMLYIIPVVFHVLHMNGPENISKEQILDAINVMNIDMKKLNADTATILPEFKHLAGKLNIEFRLATIDPDGNCTDGIDRIYTSRTNYGNDSAKINPWPREKYLNIWTVKAVRDGWAAYAYYPSAADAVPVHDGIMTLHNYVGSIGTSDPFRSRTLTHEVGHWLDLGHPWNTTINISINVGLACGNDLVEDTPITKGHTTCPSNLRIPDCTIEPITQNYLTFDSVTTTSGTIDNSPISTGFDNLTVAPFQAVGLSSNSTVDGAFSFSNWNLGAADGAVNYTDLTGVFDASNYYEWTFTPDTGYTITPTLISFNVKRTSTGPRTFSIRSSNNSFNLNLNVPQSQVGAGVSVQAGSVLFFEDDIESDYIKVNIPLSGPQFSYLFQPLTFRFYAWNSEDSLGAFSIDSVSLSGTTGVIENIQNFMEYSYCSNMWTIGQCDRMYAALNSPLSGRNNLWSTSNLIATGVISPSSPCVPKPDFYASRNRLCFGDNVTFTMNETNADATSQLWSFPGGTPSTSTASSPTVTYPTPGTYSVSLITTNASGSSSITKNTFITVDGNNAIDAQMPFYEEFDNEALFEQNWMVTNLDSNDNKWTYDANYGFGGPGSVCVNGQNPFYLEIDELMSPYYSLSPNTIKLNFKLAAASENSIDSDDKLLVYYKKNCDSPWLEIRTYNANELYYNADQSTPFFPNTGSDWVDKSLNISSSFRTDEFQFKFVYFSDYYTNKLYIDRINLGDVLDVEEIEASDLSIQIFPVPTSNDFKVSYYLPLPAQTQIKVMDISGKIVYSTESSLTEAGQQESSVNFEAEKGVYFVVLTVNGKSYVSKQIIE